MATHPALGTERFRIFRETALPALPLELVNGLLAAATVLVWGQVGLAAAAGLLVVLVITVPMAYTIGRLPQEPRRPDSRSDRCRTSEPLRWRGWLPIAPGCLSEVLHAEGRERARLAESLHDGPMQRLVAMRQDMAEAGDVPHQMDAAIAETRAIISSFHPATVRELGFEASLRAAVAPFPSARATALNIRSGVDDWRSSTPSLLPVAQELVVNAVKHASPSAINVQVTAVEGTIVVEVNDDGVGIDTSATGRAVQAGHVGLAMVRRRVEDAGGVLEIATRSDGGTRSRVVVPNTLETGSYKPKGLGGKPPRPFVGRMFYYVLLLPALSCSPSGKRHSKCGGRREWRGRRVNMGFRV